MGESCFVLRVNGHLSFSSLFFFWHISAFRISHVERYICEDRPKIRKAAARTRQPASPFNHHFFCSYSIVDLTPAQVKLLCFYL